MKIPPDFIIPTEWDQLPPCSLSAGNFPEAYYNKRVWNTSIFTIEQK